MNIDNRPKPPSQQKLAEKLIILNERAQGLLTRLHYSKQVILLLLLLWTNSNFLNNILVQGNYVAYEANLEKPLY